MTATWRGGTPAIYYFTACALRCWPPTSRCLFTSRYLPAATRAVDAVAAGLFCSCFYTRRAYYGACATWEERRAGAAASPQAAS